MKFWPKRIDIVRVAPNLPVQVFVATSALHLQLASRELNKTRRQRQWKRHWNMNLVRSFILWHFCLASPDFVSFCPTVFFAVVLVDLDQASHNLLYFPAVCTARHVLAIWSVLRTCYVSSDWVRLVGFCNSWSCDQVLQKAYSLIWSDFFFVTLLVKYTEKT